MIVGHDLMNELGIILDFKNKTITWDKAQIIMQTYPSKLTTETLSEQWFLETADCTSDRMNDDGIYPLSKISATPEDIHYQETSTTSNRYK